MNLQEFRDVVLSEGLSLYRHMPWRNTRNPYHILLSEVMLQQTQVDRVVEYYQKFIDQYPQVEDLAQAPLPEVLGLWSGLGYNRRAKWLKESAQKIVSDFEGAVPQTIEDLVTLPGIGHNTAAAICVYAFNTSENFVETNIRTVFIYHLYSDKEIAVSDKEILSLQAKILESGVNPREWYLALMDYGTYLKKNHRSITRKSHSYRKQSAFAGSVRQVRGAVLKLLLQSNAKKRSSIDIELAGYDKNLQNIALTQLINEGFIVKDSKGRYALKK